jgi:hypothetical protein
LGPLFGTPIWDPDLGPSIFWKSIQYSNNLLTEYSNNTGLLNKPFKTVDFQAIVPKYLLKTAI